MAGNIGIGIANAIGFNKFKGGGNILPKPIAVWSAAGKTNEDDNRAILEDLTGNGHDITLNGFAFSEMSGYGGYKVSFNSSMDTDRSTVEIHSSYFILTEATTGTAFLEYGPSTSKQTPSYKVKVTGLKTGERLRYRAEKTDDNVPYFIIREDGIYTLPAATIVGNYQNSWSLDTSQYPHSCNVRVDVLPEYPDALVFDGVDDYTSYIPNFPKDLGTIIIDIQQLEDNKSTMLFGTPREGDISSWVGGMYIRDTSIRLMSYPFEGYYDKSYKNKYNRQIITFGWDNNSGIKYGWINYESDKYIKNFANYKTLYGFGRDYNSLAYANMAFYSAYLFDRSLTEEEIKAFIRKNIDPSYLLPSEIPTPDCYYDFSLGSNDDANREVVKDQSGNGNDAKIYNCAFAGMSGYGGYVTNLYSYPNSKPNYATINRTYNTIEFVGTDNNTGTFGAWMFYFTNQSVRKTKIELSYTNDNSSELTAVIHYIYFDGTSNKNMSLKNGIIELPESIQGDVDKYYGILVSNSKVGDRITIKELPEYEGALVLDGVDDYVALEAFDSGFKTVFMLCNPFKLGSMLYDQRISMFISKYDFGIYAVVMSGENPLAYNARNINGTYINGVFNNNIRTENTLSKKHLIMVKSELTQLNTPKIGTNYNISNNFANMAIYKFLGFKEALNEDQIKAVIQKYNLLDGVDDIQVS